MTKHFDAVDIETSISRFMEENIGVRGTSWDADIFRGGRHEKLALALSEIVETLEFRTSSIGLTNEDQEAGHIGAQLRVAISRLKNSVEYLEHSNGTEPNDYHWSIVASLLTVINTLLTILKRTHP